MRESRQSSVLSVTDKLKYPKCEKKKEHGKESLNFVCLSAQCKSRGLICVQCKTGGEHTGHNVQPLRTFLTKLEESLKKIELQREPKMEEKPTPIVSERSLLERLEEQHLEMFSLLKIQIEEISEKIRNCQDEVLREYSRVREKIFTEFQKETIIGKTLSEVQKYFSEGSDTLEGFDLKFSISKLLSLLKIQKNSISVTNEAEMQLNSYVLAGKTFKNNILVWERQTTNIISDIFKSKPQYQFKEGLVRPTTAIDSSSKPLALAFSSQFRTDSVMLDKDSKIIKGKDDKHGKVALLNHSVVESKSGPIRFKISNLSAGSMLQIGVCLKSIISQKSYKFQKNNAHHGLFVASSNSFLYSSGDSHINNTKGGFLFKNGDEVSIQVDAKDSKLMIKKKNDHKTVEISLKHISEADWKELYYCVNLGSTGDKIQFLG